MGVQVVPSSSSTMNVSFLYTDVNKYSSSSNVLATFSVPWKIRKYSRLSLKVTRESVRLFGRCMEPQTVAVIRDPMELLFDSASTLYIGQAGPLIKGPFDVSILNISVFLLISTADKNGTDRVSYLLPRAHCTNTVIPSLGRLFVRDYELYGNCKGRQNESK